MWEFIDYNQRDCALPPGCKDLLDVLLPERSPVKSGTDDALPFEISSERFQNSGLAQLERFVSMLTDKRYRFFTVIISGEDEECPVTLHCSTAEPNISISVRTRDNNQKFATIHYFKKQRVKPRWNETSWLIMDGEGFFAMEYLVPVDGADILTLTSNLLREVYGLNDESSLTYSHYGIQVTV